MIDYIKVKVMGVEKKIIKGTTLLELVKDSGPEFKYPIILAKVDGKYRELSKPVNESCEIEFLDFKNKHANRSYVNALIFLIIYSVHNIFDKKSEIKVRHSIDKGIYIETNFKISKEKLADLKEYMMNAIHKDIRIEKCNVNRLEAMEYFEKIGDDSKVGLLKYNTNNYITLYKLGNEYNYFFTKMPISTACLGYFELEYLNEFGFVLLPPTVYRDDIKKYEHHPQMFQIFDEYHKWKTLMNVGNLASLNAVVSSGNIADLIRIDETLQSNRLLNIAKDIVNNEKKIKVVLMAGPSSSGKTTTSKKLKMYLRSFGLNPKEIAMDDYFVDRENTPKDEKGEFDYECLEAVNTKLFDEQMKKLLNGEEVTLPVYNFKAGKSELKNTVKLEENSVLLIEGIHALNPKILTSIPEADKYRIYLSPLTILNIDNHNRVPTTDIRLLRRIIRDNRTRGHKVEDTLRSWAKVRAGEEKHIFINQDEADCTYNTAFIYELGILKTYAEPLLYSVDVDSEYYEDAKRLINLLKTFLPIPSEDIPDDSLLREFIGGSCFK